MRSILIAAIAIIFSACVGVQQRPQVFGGQNITQPGVSFVVPENKSWIVLVQSTYQITLGTMVNNSNETFVVSISTHKVPLGLSPQDFLAHVKSRREATPPTGRLEIIKNDAQLYTERREICVKHEAKSKDYGAKRGSDYSIHHTFGMYCIHPKNPTIAIFIELSRTAPDTQEDPHFKTMGAKLLQSIEFRAYR